MRLRIFRVSVYYYGKWVVFFMDMYHMCKFAYSLLHVEVMIWVPTNAWSKKILYMLERTMCHIGLQPIPSEQRNQFLMLDLLIIWIWRHVLMNYRRIKIDYHYDSLYDPFRRYYYFSFSCRRIWIVNRFAALRFYCLFSNELKKFSPRLNG